MSSATDISPAIVEALYIDALVLADEARSAFEFADRAKGGGEKPDMYGMALSCVVLRTTTRMMQAITWLLNRRAFFAGQLSEQQLRRHGQLPPPDAESNSGQLALLDPELRDVVERTVEFYERVVRLDRSWRDHFAAQPVAIHSLRERLDQVVKTL